MNPEVLFARFRRLLHCLSMFWPARWPPHRPIDEYTQWSFGATEETALWFWRRTDVLSCSCGRVFFERKR